MPETKTFLRQKRSDLLGVLASGLCAIHCTLTPIFFLAKPILDNTVENQGHGNSLWTALEYVFLVLSLIAVWFSSKHTNLKSIKWILWSAWIVFSIGLLSERIHFENGIWLMYSGSAALVIAHVINYRHCQKCKKESCETDYYRDDR